MLKLRLSAAEQGLAAALTDAELVAKTQAESLQLLALQHDEHASALTSQYLSEAAALRARLEELLGASLRDIFFFRRGRFVCICFCWDYSRPVYLVVTAH